MVKRYELTDAQWERIADLLPDEARDPVRTAADSRLFVNGVLWLPRSGAHWLDRPERYGKPKSVHKRFSRWAKTPTELLHRSHGASRFTNTVRRTPGGHEKAPRTVAQDACL